MARREAPAANVLPTSTSGETYYEGCLLNGPLPCPTDGGTTRALSRTAAIEAGDGMVATVPSVVALPAHATASFTFTVPW